MAFLNYLLVLMGSYSGLVLGSLLAIVVKEEMQNGRKYLSYLQMLILSVIVFVILLFLDIGLIFSIVATLIISFIIAHFKLLTPKTNLILYPIYGIFSYILSLNVPYDVLFPSLVFLYGLPTGSLMTDNKKDLWKNAWQHASYLALGLATYAVFNLL